MCKSAAEGGQRCASALRSAHDKARQRADAAVEAEREARAALNSAVPGTAGHEAARAAFFDARRAADTARTGELVAHIDYAMTPSGRAEVTARLDETDPDGPEGRALRAVLETADDKKRFLDECARDTAAAKPAAAVPAARAYAIGLPVSVGPDGSVSGIDFGDAHKAMGEWTEHDDADLAADRAVFDRADRSALGYGPVDPSHEVVGGTVLMDVHADGRVVVTGVDLS